MTHQDTPEDPAAHRPVSSWTIAAWLVVVLGGLPLAVWMDLRALSERQLSSQAGELAAIIDDIRDFYAENVVARAVSSPDGVTASHLYLEEVGGIPIPATFSLELVSIFSDDGDTMTYRFVSDHPFATRAKRQLTQFERRALDALTEDPNAEPIQVSGGLFDRAVSVATPVTMVKACVECHNAHPDSPRQGWQVGDVRGIQAITVRQNIGLNSAAFVSLTAYFALLVASAAFVMIRIRKQTRALALANEKMAHANDYLATLSHKVGRYISPKIYRHLFLGTEEEDVTTNRRKLTIFFSDLQDFTEISERLQPEELTALLNTYFTEMARIAEDHGGTLDKFIGDAVLVFFGDPTSLGVREDARACMRMAVAMRRRLEELADEHRARGATWPFKMRIGINTGYCNVGNFGSEDRLSYTIIGAEVNLAARLQEHCDAGEIAVAQETYFYVSDMVTGRPAEPMHAKGIAQPVSYHVVGAEAPPEGDTMRVNLAGLQLSIDTDELTGADRDRAKASLQAALDRLEKG